MLEKLLSNPHAAIQDPSVLVKFPAPVIIPRSSVFASREFAVQQAHPPASEVVKKGMSQANGFIFHRSPTGMKTSYVVGEIAGEKTMLSSLNGLFEPFTRVARPLLGFRAGENEAGGEQAEGRTK